MKQKIQLALIFTLLFALVLPTTVFAKGLQEDKIVLGGSYTLASGEQLDGNLVVFGGTATLEDGSTVVGDVVILGGNLDANGEITGSVVGVGGNVQLGDSAVVDRDVMIIGSTLDRALGATVAGEVVNGLNVTGPFSFRVPTDVRVPRFQLGLNPIFSFVWFSLKAFLWAILAVVLLLFLPKQFDRIGQTAVKQPLISGGLGLLTAIIFPAILFVLLVTLICSPLSLLGMLILAVAWAFGLIALGLELGNRLAEMAKQDWAPALSAGFGTLILILVLNGLRAIVPCVGWVFPTLAGMVGLGAVILTRFGSQDYPQTVPFQGSPPPPPAPVMPAPPPAVELPTESTSQSSEGPSGEEPPQEELPPAI